MKKKAMIVLFCLLLVLILAFSGCGRPAVPEDDVDRPPEVGDDWPGSITMGTALAGGVYFFYGTGAGSLIDEVVGMPVYIEQTGGPGDNMRLVHQGVLDLGMITLGIGYQAWEGQEGTAFEGDEHRNVRAMFPMYSTYSHWWAHKDDGITSLRDLAGKRVGVGPTGGTPGTCHPLILETLGIEAEPVWGSLSDLVASHLEGQLGANSFAAGLPVGGLLSYAANVGFDHIVMLPIDGPDRTAVVEAFPFWEPAAIPADAYDFLDEDLETISVFNWAICHKDLPEDLVYQMVDAVMTNHNRMMNIHDAARETVPGNIQTNTFLPLHPGAARWFEDHGYAIPAGAAPMD